MTPTFSGDLLEDSVLICIEQERRKPRRKWLCSLMSQRPTNVLIFLAVFLSLQGNQRAAPTEGIKSDIRMAEQNYR